jgi:hypothetical protein
MRFIIYTVYQNDWSISNGHNSFGNAPRNKFPTWNETAGIEVLIAYGIPLSSFSVGP